MKITVNEKLGASEQLETDRPLAGKYRLPLFADRCAVELV